MPQNMPQQTAETMFTRQSALDVNMIVGSAGFDYKATNTQYDTGMAGVQGGYYSSGGMGLACGRRQPPQPYGPRDGMIDTRPNYNYDSRGAQSAMHSYQSNMQKCGAGF